jgi:type II secretory pathway pseudopilin PulG
MLTMKIIKNPVLKNQVGDTIIEVLIVLAVLGFAFTTASVTAGRGLHQSRNAQEHSQALGILNTQMELLRRVSAKQTPATPDAQRLPTDNTVFCINATTTQLAAALTDCERRNGDINYVPTIQYVGSPPTGFYRFTVAWDGIGSLGRQTEVMNYRVHQLTATANSGVNLSTEELKVTVTVKAIKPFAWVGQENAQNPAPSCSNTTNLRENVNNVSIVLNQLAPGGGGSMNGSTADGTVTFMPVGEGTTQRAVRGAIPAGFTACQGNNSSANSNPLRPNAANPNAQAEFTIVPTCTNQPGVRGPDRILYGPVKPHRFEDVYTTVDPAPYYTHGAYKNISEWITSWGDPRWPAYKDVNGTRWISTGQTRNYYTSKTTFIAQTLYNAHELVYVDPPAYQVYVRTDEFDFWADPIGSEPTYTYPWRCATL